MALFLKSDTLSPSRRINNTLVNRKKHRNLLVNIRCRFDKEILLKNLNLLILSHCRKKQEEYKCGAFSRHLFNDIILSSKQLRDTIEYTNFNNNDYFIKYI